MIEYVRAMTARYRLNEPEHKATPMHPNEQVGDKHPADNNKPCKHGTPEGAHCPQCFTQDGKDNAYPATVDPVVTITQPAPATPIGFVACAWTPKGMNSQYCGSADALRAWLPSSVHSHFEAMLRGDALFAYVGEHDAYTFVVVRCLAGASETPQAARAALATLHSALADAKQAVEVIKRTLP